MEDSAEFHDWVYRTVGHTLNTSPAPEVIAAAKMLKSGKVLDIGCGLGRNSLYLAKQGFDVTAIDLSQVAIQMLREEATQRGVQINAIIGDVKQALLPTDYSLIICTRTLQHLEVANSQWMIKRMQEKVIPGGLNVVTVYCHGPLEDDRIFTPGHFFNKNEIRDLYKDWKIVSHTLEVENLVTEENDFETLIAQKPKQKKRK